MIYLSATGADQQEDKMALRKIKPGEYEVEGTQGSDGQPLRVVKVYDDSLYGGSSEAERTSWDVRDAGERVAWGFTRSDAVSKAVVHDLRAKEDSQ